MDPFSLYYYGNGAVALLSVLAVYAVVLAVTFVLLVAMYIVQGIAMRRMANKVGIDRGWRGFIPLADDWLLGRLADVGKAGGKTHWLLLLLDLGATFGLLLSLGATIGVVVAVIEGEGVFPPSIIMAFGIMALGYFMLLICGICYGVFVCMAYYRLAKNFGGTSFTGYFIALLLCVLLFFPGCCVVLLLLSRRIPAETAATAAPTVTL